MKKYRLTKNTRVINGIKVYQIQSLQNFADVKINDLGGYVAYDSLLPHDGNVWLYEGTIVLPNVKIHPTSFIGKGVTIKRGVSIDKNTFIDEGASIGKYTVIDQNVYIGAGTYIHSQASIGKNTSIKQFVSIGKNTSIGRNVRIGSFAYIGKDTYINKDICINDGVFIGSNAIINSPFDYISTLDIDNIYDNMTFYRTKSHVRVISDGFEGTIEKFKESIKQDYSDNECATEYLLLADLAQLRLSS